MKKYTLLIVLFFICFSSYSQNKKNRSVEFMIHFKENYNTQSYGKIYNLFSARLQKAVPRKKWDSIMTDMNNRIGLIENFNFIEVSNNAVRFNVAFEKGNERFKIYPDKNILNKMNGFLHRSNPYFEQNISSLSLPFSDGTWKVTQGGDTRKMNNHRNINYQKYAFDFALVNENGKLYEGNKSLNESYYGFGKDIIAPANATVVVVIDGIKDNFPGHINRYYYSGNSILLKTDKDEFLFFGHLKYQSTKVKEGDIVKEGQAIAQCGNSGSSYFPKIHFHIQNIERISAADGVKCYFNNIVVNDKLRVNYSPVKGDLLKAN